jgi:predicted solute-binding protein
MVLAVWAGRREVLTPQVAAAFRNSCAFGLQNLERIAAEEACARGFTPDLVRRYLGSHIVSELGAMEGKGMELFLEYAKELNRPAGLTPAGAL